MTTITIDPSGLSDGAIPNWQGTDYSISSGKIVSYPSGIIGYETSHSFGGNQDCTMTVDTVGTSGGGVWNPGPMILWKSLTGELGVYMEYAGTYLHMALAQWNAEIAAVTRTIVAGDTLRLYSTLDVATDNITIHAEHNGVDIPEFTWSAINPGWATCDKMGMRSQYLPGNAKISMLVMSDYVGNPAPTYSGTISNISATQSVAITPIDVSSLFSDAGDTLTYSASPAGTSWPSGMAINSSTAVITGTMPIITTTSGHKVRATDSASQTVDSNAFSVTVSAPATRSISVNLTSDGSTAIASATGLKAAWWDATFPSGSPLLTSSSKTTDGSGVFAWTLTGSTLGSGGVGYLVVTNSDGTTTQSPVPWAVALPVAVT